MELLEYLYKNINKSKNTVKNILKNGNVYINGKVVTKHNYLLKETDNIEIRNKINNVDIIYEDKEIIVVDKPSNMLTISTEKEKEKTLYHIVSSYVKKINKSNKIFVVHRLDKDTSGLVVFAKNEITKNKLQDNWDKVVRKYVAVVEGITKDKEELKSYLEEKNNKVYSSSSGKLAITEYTRLLNNDKYSLLDINIKTGRKHQIRVQLKDINHPIIGDRKYGRSNPIRRMGLHAYKLEFKLNGKDYNFEISYPNSFKNLIK